MTFSELWKHWVEQTPELADMDRRMTLCTRELYRLMKKAYDAGHIQAQQEYAGIEALHSIFDGVGP